MVIKTIFVIILLFIIATTVEADTLVLKNGSKVECNIVEETDELYVVEVDGGTVEFSKSEVKSISKREHPAVITTSPVVANEETKMLMVGERDNIVVGLGRRYMSGSAYILSSGERVKYDYKLAIKHKSNFPIELNYLIDAYYYITTDEKVYQLEADDSNAPYYPDGVTILNPGEGATVKFKLSRDKKLIKFLERLTNNEVKEMLIIINYGKTKIALAP